MRSKKKVIECAVVLAFTLAVAVEAVPKNAVTSVTNEAEQYTEVYISEEALANHAGEEIASKPKTLIDIVAEPEYTLETRETEKEPENIPEETIEDGAARKGTADGKEKEPKPSDGTNEEKELVAEGTLEAAKETEKSENGAETAEFKNEEIAASKDDVETEESKTDLETEESKTDLETGESKTDLETEESKTDLETEESKTDLETEEPKADMETEGPEDGVETGESKTEIDTEGSETDIATDKSKGVETEEESVGEILPETEGTSGETEEISEWDSRIMPEVEDYLNIRSEGNDETDIVGKLYKGAAAEILERGDEWTKISSGNVEGYVKNDFCVFNEAAEAMAKEQGTTYAISLTGGLRVRAGASDTEETKILDLLEEGKKLKVDKNTDAPEGWIAVIYSDQTAYVSGQYVSVELELGTAISIEEEQAAIRAAQEEEERNRAAQNGAVSASYDEITLLGALIQCEAGSESYEGQLAVGAVVMNRLRSGYAGSISGVIYQSGQFTPASNGTLAGVLSRGVNGSCLQAAQEAINGADNVGGSTSFRRVSSGRSGIVIGNHVFF